MLSRSKCHDPSFNILKGGVALHIGKHAAGHARVIAGGFYGRDHGQGGQARVGDNERGAYALLLAKLG